MALDFREIAMHPIGIIYSPFKNVENVPIQSSSVASTKGTIEIFPKYASGLKDIEEFSHLILIYHFHLINDIKLHVIPYLSNEEKGIFSTRAPIRPNHIGLSYVQLLNRNDNLLIVKGLDIIDRTPLLDIKPYVPQFDNISHNQTISIGWLSEKVRNLHKTTDDGRFINK